MAYAVHERGRLNTYRFLLQLQTSIYWIKRYHALNVVTPITLHACEEEDFHCFLSFHSHAKDYVRLSSRIH